MIEVVMRQMPAEVPKSYKVSVNGTEAGYVVEHAERAGRWYVMGRDTVYVSKEAAACMIATRHFEQDAINRKRKPKTEKEDE